MWEIVGSQKKYVNIQGNGQATLKKEEVVMGTKLISEKQNIFFFLNDTEDLLPMPAWVL